MIDTQQWRAAIDAFASGKRSIPATSRDNKDVVKTTTITSSRSMVCTGLLLLCSYSLFTIAILLVIGGVETNPGPVNCKKCPTVLMKQCQ